MVVNIILTRNRSTRDVGLVGYAGVNQLGQTDAQPYVGESEQAARRFIDRHCATRDLDGNTYAYVVVTYDGRLQKEGGVSVARVSA